MKSEGAKNEEQSHGLFPKARSHANTNALTDEERYMLEGHYHLTPEQANIYRQFTEMLSEFDVSIMMTILEDTLRDAQKCTMLADYDGTELV
mmetsp:Transcript_37187/g.46866  ORF Transcript_37187/g.46866 Transcript_37187/m.46866 type:complete len:92 (-) Transcript_37187:3-278(-)